MLKELSYKVYCNKFLNVLYCDGNIWLWKATESLYGVAI